MIFWPDKKEKKGSQKLISHLDIINSELKKTTFKLSYIHYEFLALPFNLTNALATFMCLMNDLF